MLCLKLSKTKFKNRSNFLDECLILHWLCKIKGQKLCLLKQIFPEGQMSIFSVHCPAHLLGKLFLFFFTNYQISWQLLMIIILDHPLTGQFYTIWQAYKRLTFWYMLSILNLCNFLKWPSKSIHKNHWEVECCTVILILFSNKYIRILI